MCVCRCDWHEIRSCHVLTIPSCGLTGLNESVMRVYQSEGCNDCFCFCMSFISYIVLNGSDLCLRKCLTIASSMHFPAEMLPNTIFPSKSIQPYKNIQILLKECLLWRYQENSAQLKDVTGSMSSLL